MSHEIVKLATKMFTSREEDSSYTTESKYVADILSSMANGEPVTPNVRIVFSHICSKNTIVVSFGAGTG